MVSSCEHGVIISFKTHEEADAHAQPMRWAAGAEAADDTDTIVVICPVESSSSLLAAIEEGGWTLSGAKLEVLPDIPNMTYACMRLRKL